MPLVLTDILLAMVLHLSDLYPNGLTGPVVSFAPLGHVPHVRPTSLEGKITAKQGGKAITILPFNTDTPLTFTAYGPLARKGFFPGSIQSGGESLGYLLDDVQVGDSVDLHLVRVGKYDRVIAVQIFDRPKGKVPPSRVKLRPEGQRYHDARNALIANKKFGTPLPKFLQPDTRPLFPPDK